MSKSIYLTRREDLDRQGDDLVIESTDCDTGCVLAHSDGTYTYCGHPDLERRYTNGLGWIVGRDYPQAEGTEPLTEELNMMDPIKDCPLRQGRNVTIRLGTATSRRSETVDERS